MFFDITWEEKGEELEAECPPVRSHPVCFLWWILQFTWAVHMVSTYTMHQNSLCTIIERIDNVKHSINKNWMVFECSINLQMQYLCDRHPPLSITLMLLMCLAINFILVNKTTPCHPRQFQKPILLHSSAMSAAIIYLSQEQDSNPWPPNNLCVHPTTQLGGCLQVHSVQFLANFSHPLQ